jgi:hypothetical protein
MKRAGILTISVCAAALGASYPAIAASEGGCQSFDFPVATELQWLRQPDAEPVSSGATLPSPPAKALAAALKPVAEVSYTLPPEGKAKDGETAYGATVAIEKAGGPGLYQVSLSAKGWIDVVQDGKAVKSAAHSGKSDCEGLRKSVRFDLKDGPFVVQISGVSAPSIKLTIRKAD